MNTYDTENLQPCFIQSENKLCFHTQFIFVKESYCAFKIKHNGTVVSQWNKLVGQLCTVTVILLAVFLGSRFKGTCAFYLLLMES